MSATIAESSAETTTDRATVLGEWRYGGFHSHTVPVKECFTDYWNAVAPEDVPALCSTRRELEAAGYSFIVQDVAVSRCERTADEGKTTSYSVWHVAHFTKGEGKLHVTLRGGGPTLDAAIAAATASAQELSYHGDPVPGGKGQLRACREIAARIFAEHGGRLTQDGTVTVHYKTRGGRGGYREKTAARQFKVAEVSEW